MDSVGSPRNEYPTPQPPSPRTRHEEALATTSIGEVESGIDRPWRGVYPPPGYRWSDLTDLHRLERWTPERLRMVVSLGESHWQARKWSNIRQRQILEFAIGLVDEEPPALSWAPPRGYESWASIEERESERMGQIIPNPNGDSDRERFWGRGEEMLRDYRKARSEGLRGSLRDFEVEWVSRDLPASNNPLLWSMRESRIIKRRQYLRREE